VNLPGVAEVHRKNAGFLNIIELVNTIIVYTFTNLSRQEIEMMLGTKLEETRVYRDAQEEKAIELALKMLQEGATLDFVTKVTGFTIEQLQALQAQA
jgi:predicted transposase YdaD